MNKFQKPKYFMIQHTSLYIHVTIDLMVHAQSVSHWYLSLNVLLVFVEPRLYTLGPSTTFTTSHICVLCMCMCMCVCVCVWGGGGGGGSRNNSFLTNCLHV